MKEVEFLIVRCFAAIIDAHSSRMTRSFVAERFDIFCPKRKDSVFTRQNEVFTAFFVEF
jgi:hypothetical protein